MSCKNCKILEARIEEQMIYIEKLEAKIISDSDTIKSQRDNIELYRRAIDNQVLDQAPTGVVQ